MPVIEFLMLASLCAAAPFHLSLHKPEIANEDTEEDIVHYHEANVTDVDANLEGKFRIKLGDIDVSNSPFDVKVINTQEATSASPSGTTTASTSSFDYCSISPDHTMCKYSGPSDTCKAKTIKSGLSDTDKLAIVNEHNKLRRIVAKGEETRGNPGPQPEASDMLLMVWDDELAAIAQRWTDQCTFRYDDNRDTNDGVVGQNVALSGSNSEISDDDLAASYASATKSWYDVVYEPGFSKDNVKPFVKMTGTRHYSQVVWASSRKVGCGAVYYNSGSSILPFRELVICNYFKGGNVEGAAMYSRGKACSACPSEYPTCSDGLCTV